METTLKLKIVLEVPDSEQKDVEKFKTEIAEFMKGKLFHIYAVRNILVEKS